MDKPLKRKRQEIYQTPIRIEIVRDRINHSEKPDFFRKPSCWEWTELSRGLGALKVKLTSDFFEL